MKRPLLVLIFIVFLAAVGVILFTSQSTLAPDANTEVEMEDTTAPAVGGSEGDAPVVADEGETCLQKNEVCGVSNDCCQNLGLECQEVTLSSGSKEKRCMPFTKRVCEIECGTDGVWGRLEGCSNTTVPSADTPDCETLTGTCDPSVNEERNVRKCWTS